MFAKLHLLSQDTPEGGAGLRWRAHPYLRVVGAIPKGPAVFDWNERQREDLEALWRDPSAEGARERLARDLAAFCDKLGWAPEADLLEDAEKHGDEYLLTLSAVPPELYVLPWEVIQVGAAGTYLSDYASAQVRYAMPGLEPREIGGAPPAPGVLFAWSAAGGAVPHEEQAAAIRAAAEAGSVSFRELAEVDEGTLQAALDAGPPSVLHLLCHGLPGPDGEPPRIKWGASDGPSEITATRLARMLRHHSGAIRLVVLSACGGGDGRGDPLFMGSMAQELHKKGIPTVVASRYPLSVRGSRVMTRALYDKLLREAWSLERALRHTRQALFRVDEDGESHPGDAYGIQLYAYDTERFLSDNEVEAERPVLASYPFGTAARPVPASGPPAAELTMELEEAPGLDEEELAARLRRVSEDEGLTIEVRPGAADRARSLIVRTTVDGAQRLLGAWRSKVLQTALGVIVGGLILTQAILPALAATSSAAAGKSAAGKSAGGEATKAAQVMGQATGNNAAAAATAAAGKTTAAAAGKTAAAIAGKAMAAKLAVAAVVGGVVVGGGAVVYRTQTQSAAPAAPAAPAALTAEARPGPAPSEGPSSKPPSVPPPDPRPTPPEPPPTAPEPPRAAAVPDPGPPAAAKSAPSPSSAAVVPLVAPRAAAVPPIAPSTARASTAPAPAPSPAPAPAPSTAPPPSTPPAPSPAPAPASTAPAPSPAPAPTSAPTIKVLAATYGDNVASVPKSNATAKLAASCDGKTTCEYAISVASLGDPAVGSPKTFVASYQCTGDAAAHNLSVPAEANGRTTTLSCPTAAATAPSAPSTSTARGQRGRRTTVGLAWTFKKDAPAAPYRSRNYGEVGSGKTVAFLVPHQAGASGPESLVWGGGKPDAKVRTTAKEKSTGKPQQLTLSGFRPTACGQYSMNDAVLCGDGKEESILGLTILEADNAAVPAGVYTGSVSIQAKGWHDTDFVEHLTFNYEIKIDH
ncbi:MAG TPA: CHAT domain-containing protein [Kofleriaceae bacterium]|nr:CHAT domain-containing protein [Kofleriaceae bacterium]